MQKKEYEAPKMSVLDFKCQGQLLSASEIDADEYDGDFGFNILDNKNREA